MNVRAAPGSLGRAAAVPWLPVTRDVAALPTPRTSRVPSVRASATAASPGPERHRPVSSPSGDERDPIDRGMPGRVGRRAMRAEENPHDRP